MNLILERVNNVCRAVCQNNDDVTFKKLFSSIRSEFKKSDIDLLLKIKKDHTLSQDQFCVSGFYDPDDDKHRETPIEIIVHHNFNPESRFRTNQIKEILIQIYDAAVHELRHQYQSRCRNFRTYSEHHSEPYARYLADPDEIDAYAFSIAIEMLRVWDKEKCKRYMKRLHVLAKMKYGPSLVSPNLYSYVEHYKHNDLLKKLSRKILKNLEIVDKTHIFK